MLPAVIACAFSSATGTDVPKWATYLGIAPTILLVAAITAHAAGIGTYVVRAESMWPTLFDGDRIVVESLADSQVASPATLRNHIVVLRAPVFDVATEPEGMVVKRVVAVGGDTIAMRAGVFLLNGKAQGPAYAGAGDAGAPSTWRYEWQAAFAVNVADNHPPAHPSGHTWGPLVVPAKSVFVLGDNRRASLDSRVFGFVPLARIDGVVSRIYLSWGGSDGHSILGQAGHSSLRTQRFWRAVH